MSRYPIREGTDGYPGPETAGKALQAGGGTRLAVDLEAGPDNGGDGR